MTRKIRRGGKIWIRVFPDKPFTKKPAETRMGKGKGAPEGWVAVVKPGRILFEMAGVPEELAKEAMRLAAHKLPIATKFVTRHETALQIAAHALTDWKAPARKRRRTRTMAEKKIQRACSELRGMADADLNCGRRRRAQGDLSVPQGPPEQASGERQDREETAAKKSRAS